MAAPKPVDGVVEIKFEGILDTRTVSVRSFWSATRPGPVSGTDVAALTTALGNSWRDDMVPSFTQDYTFTQSKGMDLSNSSGAVSEITYSTVGGQTNPGEPLNCAFVMKFLIGRRYRGGKPKIFIPGMATGNRTNEGTWTGALVTGIEENWTDLVTVAQGVTDAHGNVYLQYNVSRFTGHAERATPVIDIVTSHAGQPRICTRRRRLPKITG